jgi:hypothetical protein
MKLLSVSLLIAIAFSLPAAATDLTPHFMNKNRDGVVIRRPFFDDGMKKYGFKIDDETKLSAYEGGALFRFDKMPEASMRLRRSPVPAETGFGPETFEGYQQAARTLLPPGADAVTFVASELNPLPINHWQSLRVTFSYRSANQSYRQSAIFLNLKPTEQIVVQASADERHFEDVASRAFNIIRRWHEILPEESEPFN